MGQWQRENSYDVTIKVALFLISPFLSFIFSLRRMNTRSSYIMFFLFALFFGMSFTVGEVVTRVDFDSISYRNNFEQYKFVSKNEFKQYFEGFISYTSAKKDFYFDTIAYYVSRITDNYHVMFMVFAAIFSFFSLKSFRFFTRDDRFDNSFPTYLLAYIFMANQIFNINGMRMWTASWVVVYALLEILVNRKKKYILLLLVAPFIHVSFWAVVAVSFVAYIFIRFDKIWVFVLLLSFFVGSFALELLDFISVYLPLNIQRLIASYTSEEYIILRNSGTGFYWVPKMFSKLIMMYLNLMVFLFIRNANQIKSNSKSTYLYRFILVYMTFVNFTMSIPSLGGRFILLAYPLIAYVWLVNFKGVKYNYIVYLMPIVFMYSFVQFIGYYFAVLSPTFFLSSPFLLIYKYLIAF